MARQSVEFGADFGKAISLVQNRHHRDETEDHDGEQHDCHNHFPHSTAPLQTCA